MIRKGMIGALAATAVSLLVAAGADLPERRLAAGFETGVASKTGGAAISQPDLQVGVAVCNITPELPIRLAGYAGRKHPAEKVDNRLKAQALALKNPSGERFVFVALDNCGVSRAFTEPVLLELRKKHNLVPGSVAVVCSHTHSGPVIEGTLTEMVQPSPEERAKIQKYSSQLQRNLAGVVTAALADLKPATLEHGTGRANFAMNRRVPKNGQFVFGDNPEGPVDRDVPVLRIRGTNGAVRAVLFGYACHGTSVRSGEDWYAVSGEYMSYAREHIENREPGAVAMFLTGMGADADPSPRGQLLDARRHGLELAGAVISVLDRPMRKVSGPFKLSYDELNLPLADPPSRDQLEKDHRGGDAYVKMRAQSYLQLLNSGKPLPSAVTLPVAVLRFRDDLTFVLMGGETVADYALSLKRTLPRDNVWTIGYAYEVPCYIPSARIIKEGGYEPQTSMIFYGYYGPFRETIENQCLDRLQAMVAALRQP